MKLLLARAAPPLRLPWIAASLGLFALSLLHAGVSRAADSAAADKRSGQVVSLQVKLAEPKKGNDKRIKGPRDEITFSIYLPPGVKTIRGAVLNPFYLDTVKQKHWRAAVRQWDFALIGTNLFGVKGDQLGSVILSGLKQTAEKTGRAELEHIPLCFVGMSAGGGMSTRLTEALPERTIAAGPVCLEVGPRNAASRRIPIVTVFGERDGRQMEKLLAKLPAERAEKAQWAIAVQWRKRHEFARANNLVMPWFDRAIKLRYPADASPAAGPVKLKEIPHDAGYLGDHTAWTKPLPKVAPAEKFSGKAEAACWFPDAYTAAVWQAFVAKESPLVIVSPPGMGDGKTFTTYTAGKPISVEVKVRGNVDVDKLVLYNGNDRIVEFPAGERTVKVLTPPSGINALIVRGRLADGAEVISPPNTIIVED